MGEYPHRSPQAPPKGSHVQSSEAQLVGSWTHLTEGETEAQTEPGPRPRSVSHTSEATFDSCSKDSHLYSVCSGSGQQRPASPVLMEGTHVRHVRYVLPGLVGTGTCVVLWAQQ